MSARDKYTASLPKKPAVYSSDQREFLERRTRPFLDGIGVGKPLVHLLQEAYLQGVRDTVDVLEVGRLAIREKDDG